MTLREMQQEAYQNKVDKGFNITDVCLEFCLVQGELSEAFAAWHRRQGNVGEELADVAIYLMGISQILGVDLQSEVERKLDINRRRKYAVVDGVTRRVQDAE